MANGKSNPLNDFLKSNGEDHRTFTPGPSLTRQEFAEECDINTIMKRYEAQGGLNGLGPAPGFVPQYIDFADMPQDLMGFMQLQKDAETAFMTLPAGVRREFDNDPILFCDFASDPGNIDQMRTWGLAPPAKKPPEPPAVGPAPPPAKAGEPASAGSPAGSTHVST